MKVVCVDDSLGEFTLDGGFKNSELVFSNGHLVEGETYTVVRVINELGHTLYELSEKPFYCPRTGVKGCWISTRFVPVAYWLAEFATEKSEPQHT